MARPIALESFDQLRHALSEGVSWQDVIAAYRGPSLTTTELNQLWDQFGKRGSLERDAAICRELVDFNQGPGLPDSPHDDWGVDPVYLSFIECPKYLTELLFEAVDVPGRSTGFRKLAVRFRSDRHVRGVGLVCGGRGTGKSLFLRTIKTIARWAYTNDGEEQRALVVDVELGERYDAYKVPRWLLHQLYTEAVSVSRGGLRPGWVSSPLWWFAQIAGYLANDKLWLWVVSSTTALYLLLGLTLQSWCEAYTCAPWWSGIGYGPLGWTLPVVYVVMSSALTGATLALVYANRSQYWTHRKYAGPGPVRPRSLALTLVVIALMMLPATLMHQIGAGVGSLPGELTPAVAEAASDQGSGSIAAWIIATLALVLGFAAQPLLSGQATASWIALAYTSLRAVVARLETAGSPWRQRMRFWLEGLKARLEKIAEILDWRPSQRTVNENRLGSSSNRQDQAASKPAPPSVRRAFQKVRPELSPVSVACAALAGLGLVFWLIGWHGLKPSLLGACLEVASVCLLPKGLFWLTISWLFAVGLWLGALWLLPRDYYFLQQLRSDLVELTKAEDGRLSDAFGAFQFIAALLPRAPRPAWEQLPTDFHQTLLRQRFEQAANAYGRLFLIIDDVDILPSAHYNDILRLVRAVFKTDGSANPCVCVMAAPMTFWHAYRGPIFNDVHSSTQFAVLLGNGTLFAEARALAQSSRNIEGDRLLPESFVERWQGCGSQSRDGSPQVVLLPSELVIGDVGQGYKGIRTQLASRLLLGLRLPWVNRDNESPENIAVIRFALAVLDRYLGRERDGATNGQAAETDDKKNRFPALVKALGSSTREWIRFLEYNLATHEPQLPTGLATQAAHDALQYEVRVARTIDDWLQAMCRFRDQEWYEEHVLEHRNGNGQAAG